MPERPEPPPTRDSTDESRSALRDLVVACLERLEEEGSGAIDAICREHPEHAEELRERLLRLQRAGLLEDEEGSSEVPRELGDFALLEKIGSGAMGIVYRARQKSLDRIVALKLIRPDQLGFADVRGRFRREVELVSRLSHRGIIPVHVVGEDADVPYFAMEFVRGATLAELLVRLVRGPRPRRGEQLADALAERLLERSAVEPAVATSVRGRELFQGSYVDVCVRIAREVGEALHHAHEHGVTHRDVKPSNVLLTEDGRVLLIDFGLASSTSDAKLTRSGLQVGSLAYLPPETLREKGAVSGPSRDVYALGVTLYELLTLRAPFEARTTERTLTSIVRGQIVPPRQRNRDVPRDLETVCLMAMAPELETRYASARAFSEDLERVQRHVPVAARPATWSLRARRFLQRHPGWGVALLCAALALIVGPWPFVWLQHRATVEQRNLNRELSDANERAERNLDDARRNLALLRDLSSKLLRDIHDEILLVEGSIEARRTLVQLCLHYLSRLREQAGDDPRLLEELAEGYVRAGVVQGNPSLPNLGEFEAALANYDRSQELRERLIALEPAERRHRRELAWIHLFRAAVLRDQNRRAEALPHVRRGLELARTLAEGQVDVEDRAVHLQALLDLAHAMQLSQEIEAFDALLDEARGVLAEVPQDEEPIRMVVTARTMIEQLVAQRYLERGEIEPARAILGAQLELSERRYAAHDTDSKRAYDVVDVARQLADLEGRAGEVERAVHHLRRAVEVLRTTHARDALDVRGRLLFSTVLRHLSKVIDPHGEESGVLLAEAFDACATPSGREPGLFLGQELARVRFDQARRHAARGEPEEARALYEDAIERCASLRAEDPENRSHGTLGANALARLGMLGEAVGDEEERDTAERRRWYAVGEDAWERAAALDALVGIEAQVLSSGKTRAENARESRERLAAKRAALDEPR